MTITGEILLNPNITDIFSGQCLEVTINIENNETIFIKGIFLNLRGDVKVKWKDLLNKNKNGEIIYIMQQYEGQDICVDQYTSIQNMDVLSKGEHTYNIKLNIPQQLPQSFESINGGITYDMILGLKQASGKIEILHRKPLKIKSFLNISRYSNTMKPFRSVYSKSLCWGICGIKPLKLCIFLPTTTFIPGDNIQYYAFIQSSNQILDLQRLTVVLSQTLTYRALKPKPKEKQVHKSLISKIHHINRQHKDSRIEGFIKLPDAMEITSKECCLIMNAYKLHFIIVLKGVFTDGYLTVPITVGSHRDSIDEKVGDFAADETRLQIENNLSEVCI